MALISAPLKILAAVNAPLATEDSLPASYSAKITMLKKQGANYYIKGVCSGALFINLKTVVTAAHCLDFEFDLIRVEFGVHPDSKNYLDTYTESYAVHPRYAQLMDQKQPSIQAEYGGLQSISIPRDEKNSVSTYVTEDRKSLLFNQVLFDEFKKYYDLKLPVVFEREYKETALIYDIALIFLNQEVDAQVYMPLTLPSDDAVEDLKYGDTLAHSGFGIQNFSDRSAATHMAQSSQTLVRKKTYQGEHVGVVTFAFHHIFPCSGDSGGPLTLIPNDGPAQLIGVTAASVIKSECLDGVFYSSPLFHWDWIKSHILKRQ